MTEVDVPPSVSLHEQHASGGIPPDCDALQAERMPVPCREMIDVDAPLLNHPRGIQPLDRPAAILDSSLMTGGTGCR